MNDLLGIERFERHLHWRCSGRVEGDVDDIEPRAFAVARHDDRWLLTDGGGDLVAVGDSRRDLLSAEGGLARCPPGLGLEPFASASLLRQVGPFDRAFISGLEVISTRPAEHAGRPAIDVRMRGEGARSVWVSAGWRDSRAALLMMRGLIGTPADQTAETLTLIRAAVDLERAAGEPEPRTALLALGAALEQDGQFEPAVDVLTGLWGSRDHNDWSDGVVLQLAGLLGFALLRLDRPADVELLLHDALPLASRATPSGGWPTPPPPCCGWCRPVRPTCRGGIPRRVTCSSARAMLEAAETG